MELRTFEVRWTVERRCLLRRNSNCLIREAKMLRENRDYFLCIGFR